MVMVSPEKLYEGNRMARNRRDFLKKCLTGAAVLGASGKMGLLA